MRRPANGQRSPAAAQDLTSGRRVQRLLDRLLDRRACMRDVLWE